MFQEKDKIYEEREKMEKELLILQLNEKIKKVIEYKSNKRKNPAQEEKALLTTS